MEVCVLTVEEVKYRGMCINCGEELVPCAIYTEFTPLSSVIQLKVALSLPIN